MTTIAIGIATRRRPEGLQRLLEALGGLTFTKQPKPDLVVLVADNDPSGSAAPVCRAMEPRLNVRLIYAMERRPGLSFVRNHILDLVPAKAAALAFIDDDEVPAPGWLDELLDAWRHHGCAIVAGRVEPAFSDPVPEWIHCGDFFQSPHQPSGQPTSRGGAGNCLIDARVFRDLGLRFDDAFAGTGGEDNHFFWRVAAMGYSVIWSEEAVITEWISRERTSVRWLARREYREGGTLALVERDLRPVLRTRVRRAARGAVRIGQGAVRLGVSPPLTPPLTARAVQGIKLIARGMGMIAGSLGYRYAEYARRDMASTEMRAAAHSA